MLSGLFLGLVVRTGVTLLCIWGHLGFISWICIADILFATFIVSMVYVLLPSKGICKTSHLSVMLNAVKTTQTIALTILENHLAVSTKAKYI